MYFIQFMHYMLGNRRYQKLSAESWYPHDMILVVMDDVGLTKILHTPIIAEKEASGYAAYPRPYGRGFAMVMGV